MTTQATPPTVDQQLADLRNASHVAQFRINELEAQVDRLRKETDEAKNELKARTQDCTRLIEEAQALMRPQGEWEQEVAELRASAEIAIDRWKRSEAIRSAAVGRLTIATDELDTLREYRAYWEPKIKELSDLYTRQGGELATITQLARDLVASLHGDGNGRCWAGAKEADRLRGYLERKGAGDGA